MVFATYQIIRAKGASSAGTSLLSISTALTILWIIMLYLSFFPLIQYASTPVVSMHILNHSTSRLVKSINFSKAPSSSTLIFFHGCCSLFSIVRMKQMMLTGAHLDEVVNTHIIIFFAHTTVSMEVNPRMEVSL